MRETKYDYMELKKLWYENNEGCWICGKPFVDVAHILSGTDLKFRVNDLLGFIPECMECHRINEHTKNPKQAKFDQCKAGYEHYGLTFIYYLKKNRHLNKHVSRWLTEKGY